jgi:hypothetical protein
MASYSYAKAARLGEQRGDDADNKEVTDRAETAKVSRTIVLMPVIGMDENLIVLRHGSANKPDGVEEEGRCTSMLKYTLIDRDSKMPILSLVNPHTLRGEVLPPVDGKFQICADVKKVHCCYTLQPPYLSPDSSPHKVRFAFDPKHCAVIREYQGIDMALLKHKGKVYLIGDDEINLAQSNIGQTVANCCGVISLDALYDNNMYSSEALHICLCTEESTKPYTGQVVTGPFVVIKGYCSRSPTWSVARKYICARYPIENMAVPDLTRIRLGSKDSKLITPCALSLPHARSLWKSGCTLKLVDRRGRSPELLIQLDGSTSDSAG